LVEQQNAPDSSAQHHIHLPRRRRSSPWRLAVLAVCVIGVIILIPVWLDPLTLNELLGQTQAPESLGPLETLNFRPATNAPIVRGSPLAADDFNREVPTGFGGAKTGGSYATLGTGTVFVTGGHATISLDNDAAGAAVLTSISPTSVDALATVALSSGAPSARVGLVARARADENSYYAATIGFVGGAVSVEIDSVVKGVWEPIAGPVALDGVDPGQPIRLRMDSTGFDPTTLRARAWNEAALEPGQWSVSILGWAGELQQPGSIGLGWTITDDRHAVVTVDDFTAQGTDQR
jgi:hypothetical protein